MNMVGRREFLQFIGAGAVAHSAPQLALATADTDARFVLVLLRGAVDGLALAPPYGDGPYRRLRAALALDEPGRTSDSMLKLDGLFGLHPAFAEVHARFLKREALILHAAASPYRERSHFDGQDLLESGAGAVGMSRDGWLNRSLAALPGTTAIALASNAPLVLRGTAPVASWAPSRLPDADDSTLERLQRLYAGDEFFATRLEQALRSRDIAGTMGDNRQRRGNEAQQFGELMQSAARFLAAADGARIAVVEFGGWDTHANQGAAAGQLANRFAALDDGLRRLRESLGDAWDNTVVLAVTEFGRTVRVNGTRGTDHGTGAAALMLGGAVAGGRVVADWPGLGTLYEDRDLLPTTDLRSLFKSVLTEHLGMPPQFVEREVFPNSAAARPLRDLVKT
jgi:uncharacterized protein (DUF1501 family)